MNIRDLTFLAALALGAIVFFVLAILGKVKIREYEVDLSPSMRGLSAILATVFFVIAVWLYMMPPKTPETAQTPTSTPSLPPTSKPASANSIGDCGDAEELGPWVPTGGRGRDVDIDASDGWIHADFWSPEGQLISGYDEVSVMFEPGTRVTIVGVAGNGWLYSSSCSREYVMEQIMAHQRRREAEGVRITTVSINELATR